MGATRRWGTAIVVALIVVFGVGGAAYLWKWAKTDREGAIEDDFVVDASADARAGAKKKAGKESGRGPAGPTYEAAIASNKQEVAIGSQSAPDLSDAQLAGPMRSGAFVGECGAPDSMKVTVKVAIKLGRPWA